MSFSYSGDPSFSDIDALRFYIGDTDSTSVFLQDEELQFLIDSYYDQYGHMLGVAALAAEMCAARCAREVDVSADGVSVSVGQLQQRFNDLAASLRAEYKALNLDISMSDFVYDPNLDLSLEPLSFGIGFMDNAEAGLQDYGYAGALNRSVDSNELTGT